MVSEIDQDTVRSSAGKLGSSKLPFAERELQVRGEVARVQRDKVSGSDQRREPCPVASNMPPRIGSKTEDSRGRQ
jgi:hypothetical protein